MTDYVTILDTQIEPDAPLTSSLVTQLRDNPIAMAEGASGAPRIQDAAMGSTATNAGRDWVVNRAKLITVNADGWFAIAWNFSSSNVAAGDTISGSDLRRQSSAGAIYPFDVINGTANTTAMSGTWQAMTYSRGAQDLGGGSFAYYPSLFRRVE